MRRFFIESAEVNKPTVLLRGSEAKHIKNVLRFKPGDTIRLFDSSGFEYEAVIKRLSTRQAELSIARKFPATEESCLHLSVAQAFLKAKKMDSLLRQLCELGINRWIPFFSERSVPRPDKKRLAARMQRWQKIAKESFKQCRRSVLPQITTPLSFEEVLELGQACDVKFIFWENETQPLDRTFASRTNHSISDILIMLGPEGGFSMPEIQKARNYGFEVAGLGPRVLRSETATLSACTLIQYLYGDMGKKS